MCSVCPQLNLTLHYNVFSVPAAELDIALHCVQYVHSWTWYCITCSVCPQLKLTFHYYVFSRSATEIDIVLSYNVFSMSTAELDIALQRVQYVRSWTWRCITTCSVCPHLNLTLHHVFIMSIDELDIALQHVQYVDSWTWRYVTYSEYSRLNHILTLYNLHANSLSLWAAPV